MKTISYIVCQGCESTTWKVRQDGGSLTLECSTCGAGPYETPACPRCVDTDGGLVCQTHLGGECPAHGLVRPPVTIEKDGPLRLSEGELRDLRERYPADDATDTASCRNREG